MEQHRAARVATEEFDGSSFRAVKQAVGAEHLPLESLPLAQPNENCKIQEFGAGFVELRWMQVNAQRSARDLGCRGIRERDAPRNRRWLAVAAAGGEASQASDGVPERQCSPKSVKHGEKRHLLEVSVEKKRQEGA